MSKFHVTIIQLYKDTMHEDARDEKELTDLIKGAIEGELNYPASITITEYGWKEDGDGESIL